MIHFVNPLSFLALLTLIIPVAIHLLNRKAGKRIKIGSIQFLQASHSNRFFSLRLNEIPLLILRIALLALLILLLAKPFWKDLVQQSNPKENGWILVSPELVNNLTDSGMLPKIDSLMIAGKELRLFAADFPKLSLGDSVTISDLDNNYWSLLREADKIAPDNCTFWIFTPNRIQSFRGRRPQLKASVNWFTIRNEKQNRWIEEVSFIQNDSLKIVLGFSDSSQTYFRQYLLEAPSSRTILTDDNMPALEIIPEKQSNDFTLRLIEQDAIPEDNELQMRSLTDRLSVLICFDESRRADARYIKAALEAALEFAHNLVMIKTRLTDEQANAIDDYDLIFWLSKKSVPNDLLNKVQNGAILLSDADSLEYTEIQSLMQLDEKYRQDKIRLFRRVPAKMAGIALWKDGFGEPLLEYQPEGYGGHMQFHSRFHPLWSELVLNSSFPEWMLRLLANVGDQAIANSSRMYNSDQRMIAQNQLQPLKEDLNELQKSESVDTSLYFPVWFMAALLFVIERWMAERKPKE